jgi:hypothetical protein
LWRLVLGAQEDTRARHEGAVLLSSLTAIPADILGR